MSFVPETIDFNLETKIITKKNICLSDKICKMTALYVTEYNIKCI